MKPNIIFLTIDSLGNGTSERMDEILFGTGLKQNELKDPINAVQIAPTISKFFNINTNLPGKSII